ncbi:MAG TPA: Holliday junction branch migration protein RuvA [Candidatus Uhrbacteria bacterium]|nr:Holliday junction branch migration protein RuvA [Candidatus Uhrbacteria bacterium]
MISYLKGKISYIGTNFVEVINNDIGYKVFVAGEILSKFKIGREIEVFCFQNVKEDALDLYGFDSREKLYLFEKLVGVSGIGPKTALGVLALATVEEIESAIIRGDASILTKVSGIGKKTAERIVLELKNKFGKGKELPAPSQFQSEDADVIDGLIGLGYPADQARMALRQVDKNLNADEKIKACLKLLGK